MPTNADKHNTLAVAIATEMLNALGGSSGADRLPSQTSGQRFEEACADFLRQTFLALATVRPGTWEVTRPPSPRSRGIAEYEPYAHLDFLQELVKSDQKLAAALGRDYLISPDVVVLRHPESDQFFNDEATLVDNISGLASPIRMRNNTLPILHAVVSTKWTIRSDRAQNARTEALNLVRTRKGRLPHIVVVTAEPLPTRLASLALGTGDVDCVYHVALPELEASVQLVGEPGAIRDTAAMVEGKRLRDITDLPLDLAI